jgi:hypothetical protein
MRYNNAGIMDSTGERCVHDEYNNVTNIGEMSFVRDLIPHVGKIIYFHVIKVNINKA